MTFMRRMMNHWKIIAGVAGMVCLVGIVAWAMRQNTKGWDRSTRIARAAQRVARETLTVTPLADDASFESAQAALVEAAVAGAHEENRADLAGAARAAIGLVRAWSSGDPDAYLAWARRHDMALPPGLPIYQSWDHDQYARSYRGVVGKPMPVGISIERFYQDYFTAYFARWRGALQPVSLAVDPTAVIARLARLTHWSETVNAEAAIEANPLGSDFWYGAISYGGLMLLWPRDTLPAESDESAATPVQNNERMIGSLNDAKRLIFDPIIRARGSVLAAEVHLVFRSQTGLFVPITVWLRQRPEDGVWQTTGFAMNNVDGDVGVLPAYASPPPF